MVPSCIVGDNAGMRMLVAAGKVNCVYLISSKEICSDVSARYLFFRTKEARTLHSMYWFMLKLKKKKSKKVQK